MGVKLEQTILPNRKRTIAGILLYISFSSFFVSRHPAARSKKKYFLATREIKRSFVDYQGMIT
jgi:hypothetical protein